MTPEEVRRFHLAIEEIAHAWAERLDHENSAVIEAVMGLVLDHGGDIPELADLHHFTAVFAADLETVYADLNRRS